MEGKETPRRHLGIWYTKRVGEVETQMVGTKVDCPKGREL